MTENVQALVHSPLFKKALTFFGGSFILFTEGSFFVENHNFEIAILF